ncbi:MAG TPA: DUF177 domain-containing protein [Thermoleophilia bacterium]|nr:DUF177 domain-containing protein [Thermoleophilia bacterium]
MDTSVTRVDLSDLALRGGERWERSFRIEMAPIILGGQSCEVLIPDGVTVAVDRVAGGFLVEVSVRASLCGPCERCLREAAIEVEAKEQEFVPTTKAGWDESELSPFIEDQVVDVSALGREAVVLALPSQVVCAEECRGLCQVCGQDLNVGQCDCPAETAEERWTALRDIHLEDQPPST